ncbi:MAG: Ycf66 family protein [Cyanobium sp. LacPavin_0818_WC50_MAG_67_9]|nr:Ycf66 family protein [Cyanobium sp. LacPavin_0818_WC50_MAG_67_9]
MVNASLNWASIVGIVLAVGGALLYFMRSFKPALARDYDVFFAAVGLLCGGILFFQGWRLDPILQFGQFLLAGTTVFFAYESVRLRGVTTEQARRSSYFDDDEPMPAPGPYRPRMGGRAWGEGDVDRFDEPQPLRRRIPSREEEGDDDFYRARRPSSRAAIPERAASRRPAEDDWAPQAAPATPDRSRYSPSGSSPSSRPAPDFGARRRDRDSGSEPRRGSRPVASNEGMPRSSRRPAEGEATPASGAPQRGPAGIPQGAPLTSGANSAGGPAPGRTNRPAAGDISDADFTPIKPPSSPGPRPRDNSSRFDD